MLTLFSLVATFLGLQITRADLALSYLRFEESFAAKPTAAARLADVNRRFDRATLAYFAGNMPEALQQIDALTESVLPPKPQRALARSLRVRVEPLVQVGLPPASVSVTMTSLYNPPGGEGANRLVLRILNSKGKAVGETSFTATSHKDFRLDIPIKPDLAAPGAYVVELGWGSGALRVGRWFVLDRPLEATREGNERRLSSIQAKGTQMRQALASCRARNRLLTAEEQATSAWLLADLHSLTNAVSAEIEGLEQGRDPYAKLLGDTWRVFSHEGKDLPFRVYAPKQALKGPVPVVFALHGAGGDENMFFNAYGAGAIKRLADKHGFLVVTPDTMALSRAPEIFPMLLELLSKEYEVGRVYLLGHSFGAGLTVQLGVRNLNKVAAICCFSGGGPSRALMPPTLMFFGDLDPLAKPPGQSVGDMEVKVIRNYGHTLIVGAKLDEAIRWLLSKGKG